MRDSLIQNPLSLTILPALYFGYTTEELGPTGWVGNAGLGAEWLADSSLSRPICPRCLRTRTRLSCRLRGRPTPRSASHRPTGLGMASYRLVCVTVTEWTCAMGGRRDPRAPEFVTMTWPNRARTTRALSNCSPSSEARRSPTDRVQPILARAERRPLWLRARLGTYRVRYEPIGSTAARPA